MRERADVKRHQNNDLPNPNIQLKHICHFSQEWNGFFLRWEEERKKEEKWNLEK